MTDFMASGLLWFDDDKSRPVTLKITDAACRYRERVGFEPTVCHVHPSQAAAGVLQLGAATATTGARTRRGRAGSAERATPTRGAAAKAERGRQTTSTRDTGIPAITLTLVQNERLRPNYFFVGVADGQEPVPVALPSNEYDGSSATDAIDNAPRRRRETQPTRPAVAAQPARSLVATPVTALRERKPRRANRPPVAAAAMAGVVSSHPMGIDGANAVAPTSVAPKAVAPPAAVSTLARATARRSKAATVAPTSAPASAPTAVPETAEGVALAVSRRRTRTTVAATPPAPLVPTPPDVASSPRRVRAPHGSAVSVIPIADTDPKAGKTLPTAQPSPVSSRQRTNPAGATVQLKAASTAKPATAKPATAKPATAKPATAKPATAKVAMTKTSPATVAPTQTAPAKRVPAKGTGRAVNSAPPPISGKPKRAAALAATQSPLVAPSVPTPLSGKRHRVSQTREETAVSASPSRHSRRRATAASTSSKAPAAAQGHLWSA